MLVFSAAGIAGVLVHSLPLLLLSRIVVGIASAGIVNAALVATGRLIAREDQARFLGLQVMIGSVAAVVLFPAVAGLAGADWRLAFALHALPLLAAPIALSLPEVAGVALVRDPLVKAARLPLILLCAASFMGMVIFVVSVFGPLYLAAHGVRSAAELAMPATASAIGSIVGSSLFMTLGRRLGLDGSFLLALGLVALGLAIAGTTVAVLPFTAGILIAAIATGMFAPSLNAVAIELSPASPGKTLGLATGVLYGSMILFPLAANPLTAVMGSLAAVILVFAGAALAIALLFAARRKAVA